MLPSRLALLKTVIVASLAVSGSALLAQRGGWDDAAGWHSGSPRSLGSGEGQVEISRFRIEGAAALALAHGPIAVVAAPVETEEDMTNPPDDQRFSATFEAAVEDRLVHAGYDAAMVQPGGGQVAEVRLVRIEPSTAMPTPSMVPRLETPMEPSPLTELRRVCAGAASIRTTRTSATCPPPGWTLAAS